VRSAEVDANVQIHVLGQEQTSGLASIRSPASELMFSIAAQHIAPDAAPGPQ
jgi:hypothetical protein